VSFSSVAFLVLLAVTVPLYWALPWQRARLAVLFGASLVFYGWRHWPSVFLLLGTITLNYLLALRIEATRRRGWLIAGVVANVGLLVYFKYASFLGANLAAGLRLVGLEVSPPAPGTFLPLGLSFFTFQVMAYLVDVWRGEVRAQRSLLVFAVFKSFLGQLVAGPIVKGRHLFPQLETRRPFDAALVHRGLFLVLAGLALKLAVADALRPYIDQVYAAPRDASTVEAWLALYGYSVQLFADFWGYSTVAVGVGFLFGLVLPFNFELPYLATNLQDFWRRWHVTLSRWFRDYLYIPLGGNRRRAKLNRLLTMTLAGLWHGPAWTFVLWGFLHGLWMNLEQGSRRARAAPVTPVGRVWRGLLVFNGVSLLWVLFRAPSVAVALEVYARLVLPPFNSKVELSAQWVVWVVAFLALHPALDRLLRTGRFLELTARRQLALAALLLWLIAAYAGAPADFIYFVF
jgi:alginate O-acetyltransferase complex protein AlgI